MWPTLQAHGFSRAVLDRSLQRCTYHTALYHEPCVIDFWLTNVGVTAKLGALVSIPLQLVVAALELAVVVSLLAGALTSRRAVSLQPLEALRYE